MEELCGTNGVAVLGERTVSMPLGEATGLVAAGGRDGAGRTVSGADWPALGCAVGGVGVWVEVFG